MSAPTKIARSTKKTNTEQLKRAKELDRARDRYATLVDLYNLTDGKAEGLAHARNKIASVMLRIAPPATEREAIAEDLGMVIADLDAAASLFDRVSAFLKEEDHLTERVAELCGCGACYPCEVVARWNEKRAAS